VSPLLENGKKKRRDRNFSFTFGAASVPDAGSREGGEGVVSWSHFPRASLLITKRCLLPEGEGAREPFLKEEEKKKRRGYKNTSAL